MPNNARIYLDHAATTPMRPEAIAAVAEGMGRWANPSSPHAEGRAARAALEDARARIKAALGWDGELIFTSGASEAIALALRGFAADEIAISAVEHDAVRRAAPYAASIAVTRDGRVPAESLTDLDDGCRLMAIQSVNSETGVSQSWDRLAPALRARGVMSLADCAQSAGKSPLPDADMIVVSAHKLGGPPGIGALLVRELALLTPSGGQERGYRGGTENLPAVLGFAAALEAGFAWLEDARRFRASLDAQLVAAGAEIVAASAPRLPTIGAYRMPGVVAATQLIAFDLAGIAVSAGSACASGSLKPSHVLPAMGFDDRAAGDVIRVSFGWSTTAADVDRFVAAWTGLAQRRRTA